LLPNYHNLCPKCTQWLRRDIVADRDTNDQLIKLDGTHSWIRRRPILSSSFVYFVVCYFSVKYSIPQN